MEISRRRGAPRWAMVAAGAVMLAGLGLVGAAPAGAWSSSYGSAPAFCESSTFVGQSYVPAPYESRASTSGAGSCWNAYPISAQLRYTSGGATIAQTCQSGGGGGGGNCQYISTVGYSHYSYYLGGRHGMGTTFFNS